MESVILRAHFDVKQIRLDDPFELEPDTELIVTVLPKSCERGTRRVGPAFTGKFSQSLRRR